MKNLFAITVIFVCGIIACDRPVKGRNGITYKSAVQYNDYIVSRQTKLMQRVLDFAKAAENNLDSAEKMLFNYTGETATMAEEIKEMPPYKGDSSLRDAAAESFSFYKKVFQNDYTRIIHIRKKGVEMTDEEKVEMNNIDARIAKDEERLQKSLHNAQKSFADKNHMKLIENKMQK